MKVDLIVTLGGDGTVLWVRAIKYDWTTRTHAHSNYIYYPFFSVKF